MSEIWKEPIAMLSEQSSGQTARHRCAPVGQLHHQIGLILRGGKFVLLSSVSVSMFNLNLSDSISSVFVLRVVMNVLHIRCVAPAQQCHSAVIHEERASLVREQVGCLSVLI